MKHLLSIEQTSADDLLEVLRVAETLKQERGAHPHLPLQGQCWALLFSKSSTRTRISFEVGIRELGGQVMFLAAQEIQLGRGEPIEDTARVMGRMLHGAVIRTYAQSDVETFAEYGRIPTINALTDEEHPCQILADLFTIREKLGDLKERKICFIGDGDCNVARSWLWAAARLDLDLTIAAPEGYQPPKELLDRLQGGRIRCTADLHDAVKNADVLYTDVWVSMGKEEEALQRLEILSPYQIDLPLLERAAPGALVMHCLPAYRGKEISEEAFDAHATTIFDQAENRLHGQKAILSLLSSEA